MATMIWLILLSLSYLTSSNLMDLKNMPKSEILSKIKTELLTSPKASTASLGEYGVCGGSSVLYQSYPMIASIRRPSIEQEFRHCCGATVLSFDPPILLTAAHCEGCVGPDNEPPEFVYIGCDNPNQCLPNNVEIFRYNFNINYNEQFVIMPGYNTPQFNNDVAVIFLNPDTPIEGPVALMEVGPVELVGANDLPDNNEQVLIVGYGLTDGSNEAPNSLLAGVSNYQPRTSGGFFGDTCGSLPAFHPDITQSMFCAMDTSGGGVGSCSGDSGGPWFDPDTMIQRAVTSWGYVNCDPCYCCTQFASMAANLADPAVNAFVCGQLADAGVSVDYC